MLRELLISYLRGGTFSIFGREAMFGAWHGLTIDLRRKLVGTSHHASHEGKPCNARSNAAARPSDEEMRSPSDTRRLRVGVGDLIETFEILKWF